MVPKEVIQLLAQSLPSVVAAAAILLALPQLVEAVVELPATPVALEPGRRARLGKDMPVEMDRVISVAVAAGLEQSVKMVEQWQTKPETAVMGLLLPLQDQPSISEVGAAALRTEA
jgi:hypothetical protein